MSVDGRSVANYVLDYAERNNREISNLSLQKLVFFCHAWHLVSLGEPLVKHSFEAWEFGPVLQYLYKEFKKHGRQPISSRATRLNRFTGSQEVVPYDFPEQTRNILDEVLAFYSPLPPSKLVDLTHAAGSPWDKVYNHSSRVNPGMRIGDEQILKYYSSLPPYVSVQ